MHQSDERRCALQAAPPELVEAASCLQARFGCALPRDSDLDSRLQPLLSDILHLAYAPACHYGFGWALREHLPRICASLVRSDSLLGINPAALAFELDAPVPGPPLQLCRADATTLARLLGCRRVDSPEKFRLQVRRLLEAAPNDARMLDASLALFDDVAT
jgi:hypothetical protein